MVANSRKKLAGRTAPSSCHTGFWCTGFYTNDPYVLARVPAMCVAVVSPSHCLSRRLCWWVCGGCSRKPASAWGAASSEWTFLWARCLQPGRREKVKEPSLSAWPGDRVKCLCRIGIREAACAIQSQCAFCPWLWFWRRVPRASRRQQSLADTTVGSG